nr:small heat shock protein sHsp30.4 [Dinophyceae sp.]
MLALDALSNLDAADRDARKKSIAGVERLLEDVDNSKARLATLYQSLKQKLEQAKSAEGEQRTSSPSKQSFPNAQQPKVSIPFPHNEDWKQLRLPLHLHVSEQADRYMILATVPGLDVQELKLELIEGESKLKVRGLKVPTREEVQQMQKKVEVRLQALAEQSPRHLNRLGEIGDVAKHAYWELGQDSYGVFVELFSIPADANSSGIDASYQDGVLRIEVPKASRAPPIPAFADFGGRFSGGPRRSVPGQRPGQSTGMPHGRPDIFGGLDDNYFW